MADHQYRWPCTPVAVPPTIHGPFSFHPGYMGAETAWRYWLTDSPNENGLCGGVHDAGGVGPFDDEDAARRHAQRWATPQAFKDAVNAGRKRMDSDPPSFHACRLIPMYAMIGTQFRVDDPPNVGYFEAIHEHEIRGLVNELSPLRLALTTLRALHEEDSPGGTNHAPQVVIVAIYQQGPRGPRPRAFAMANPVLGHRDCVPFSLELWPDAENRLPFDWK